MNKIFLTAKFKLIHHWKQRLYSKFHFLLRLRPFENSLGLILVFLFAPSSLSAEVNDSNWGGLASTVVDAAGAYHTTLSIQAPTYRGLEPQINLVYNSHSGNGWLGVGWGISGL